jgi:glucosyl-3-phosphoglycerate synthase
MSDLYQSGLIATLHKLGKRNLEKIEAELLWYSQDRPIALVLPSLYSELEGKALRGIVEQLKQVNYIREVVITLGPCKKDEFQRARDYFSELPQKKTLIWNSGKKISGIYKLIEESGLHLGEAGKGKSAWMAYGYVLSKKDFRVIALHIIAGLRTGCMGGSRGFW